MSSVVVTGGSGYVGTTLIAALLRDGQRVRTTVRSLQSEGELRSAVRRGHADDDGLEVVADELTHDAGWADAMKDCAEVYHVASPMIHSNDPHEVIPPARDGTLRILRAARDAGVRRVVMTSSFAAVGYTPKPGFDYNEDDGTDPEMPGLLPYPASKAIAERAAWEFVTNDGGGVELVVINPTFILDPTLTTRAGSSIQIVTSILNGTMKVVPRQRFGVADVRDVADLHMRVMASPDAAGKRYLCLADGPTISWLHLAEILRQRFRDWADRIPTEEAPGDLPPELIIRNDRARHELGWSPRPLDTTIVDTVESLRDMGLLRHAN